jgi:hypothetical protein
MSKPATAIESVACDWLDKNAAAKYLQHQGFHTITENSIVHAAGRLKTLHEGKRVGKTHFWHKDWLDEWVESL